MMTKIQKWGNSQGFRLPKTMMDDADIRVGDDVEVYVEDGKIIIVPKARYRHRFNIDELTKKPIERDGEMDTGKAMGDEAW